MGALAGSGALEENISPYTTAGQAGVARRMWAESRYGPQDVDVLQVYQNMTGMGVGALIDHGFCTFENAGEVLTFENLIAPSGGLPMNTSGGDLAEGFIHGMGLVAEAVRQLRGESTNQVPGAKLSLMTGGPGDTMSSTALLGTADTL
jgi:acetyl-CoA acetyltransferase